MTCTVKIENGIIRLHEGVEVPDGTEVQLTLPDELPKGWFYERYKEFIGVADDLPPDLAENIDHYVHGHPKK